MMRDESVLNVTSPFYILAAKPGQKLGLFYLVNDVVQNGRKKAKDLVTAFGGVLLQALPMLQ